MKKVEIVSEKDEKEYKVQEKYCLVDSDTKKCLSPMVDMILYDELSDIYVLIDSIEEPINLHFYMDGEGNILGTGFTNIDNQMLWVQVSSEEDSYPFETYDKYKEKLRERYARDFEEIVHNNLDNSLKMVMHDKSHRKTN